MFNSGNSTPFTMPVTPAYGNGGGMGGWNSDWVALAILALIFGDGWGMGGMGGMGMFLPFMFMNGGFGGCQYVHSERTKRHSEQFVSGL